MASPKKAEDSDIIALNSIGLSLSTIAKRLNIHHTTVTMRLKNLGISPADTRRAFMEDIIAKLTPHQEQWLIDQLAGGRPVNDLVKSLIIKEFVNSSR